LASPRILIEGLGGVGGVIAGELIRAGCDCTLVTGNATIADAIATHGLRVTTPGATFAVESPAVTELAEADGTFDVALLAMKASAVVDAARATLPRLRDPGGYVVPLQNGVVEDAVAAEIGEGRVVSGIVGWGATLTRPGVVERTSRGGLHVGELDGSDGERVRGLAALLERVTPVVVSTNIRGALWSKLAINCTITTGGALTGETLGQMLRHGGARRAFLGVYREVVDTAEAQGIELERIAANPRLLYLPADAGPLRRAAKDVVMRVLGRRYRDLRSSSLQSLERGRRTEVDYLNGHVVRAAEARGLDAPLNRTLVRLIHEIEEGQRPLSPDNVGELVAAIP
jgi:2-dehydropantoate 2-reductase